MGIIIKQTIRSSIYAYSGIIIGFVTTALLMPKFLTEAQVGLVRLLTSISILLAQMSNLGFNGAGGRLFPYFRNVDRQHNGYLFWALFVSIIGLIITLGVWSLNQTFILDFLNAEKSPLLKEYLFWVIPLTIFTVFFFIFDNYSRFLFDTTSGTFLKDFLQRVFLFLAIIIFYFKLVNFSGYVMLYVLALSLPTFFIIANVWRKKTLFFKPIKNFWSKDLIRNFASLSALTFLSGFTSQVVMYLDQLQVTSQLNLSANGIYTTMMMFGTVIYTPTLHINRIGGTIVAEAWKNNDMANIQEVYVKSCLNLLIVGSLLFMVVVGNLHNIIAVLPTYSAGYWVVVWIAIGKLFDMATGLNGTILQTSKYYFWDTVFIIFLIIGTWLMNNWLIPIYGITGSALATTVIIVIFNIFRTLFVWRAFGLFPFSVKNIYVIIIAFLVFAFVYFLPILPKINFIPSYILDTPFRTAIITLMFIGLIYFFKISQDMNQMMDGFVAKYYSKIFK
jgi:O-antigen/teichoic acid export membrane protein